MQVGPPYKALLPGTLHDGEEKYICPVYAVFFQTDEAPSKLKRVSEFQLMASISCNQSKQALSFFEKKISLKIILLYCCKIQSREENHLSFVLLFDCIWKLMNDKVFFL